MNMHIAATTDKSIYDHIPVESFQWIAAGVGQIATKVSITLTRGKDSESCVPTNNKRHQKFWSRMHQNTWLVRMIIANANSTIQVVN